MWQNNVLVWSLGNCGEAPKLKSSGGYLVQVLPPLNKIYRFGDKFRGLFSRLVGCAALFPFARSPYTSFTRE